MNNFYLQFAASEAEAASGLAALGVDGKTFVIQLATWILVLLVLKKYAFGPIIKTLEKRRKTIEEGLQLTQDMASEKQKLDEEVVKAQRQARIEADELLSGSREQADAMIRAAEEKAQAKADNMINEAKKKIEEESKRAKRELEKDMVELVIQATEFVAREKIDAKKDKVLITEALKGRG